MNHEVDNAPYLRPDGDLERVAYNAALNLYKDAPQNTPILKSTLRSEAVLGIQNNVQFNVLTNQANTSGGQTTVRSSENRLAMADGFLIYGMTFMFGNELSAGTKPGSVLMQTWENPATVAVLPATIGGFGANAPSLIEAYNGRVDLQVDAVNYLNGLDMLNFKRVDTAQAGQLVYTASNTAQSFFDGGKFMPVVPFINITGRQSITFNVTFPDSTDFTLVASNRVIMALMLRGLRISNGAQYT